MAVLRFQKPRAGIGTSCLAPLFQPLLFPIIFIDTKTKQFFTDIDVRINPNWVMAEGKDDTAPYVVIYAHGKNGAGDLMKCISFTDQKELKEGLESGEWYLSIISRAIRPGADGKIMLHRQEVKSG